MDLKKFRIIALTEACSFLVLICCAIIKRVGGSEQELGKHLVEIVGPIHGVLFLVYAFAAIYLAMNLKWTVIRTLGILLGAVVPLGGFVVDWWLKCEYPNDAATPTTGTNGSIN